MTVLTRLLLFILSASLFTSVLNYVTPPNSWPEASTFQILIFFLPLLTTTTFLINIFINQILRSFVASLGIIFSLVLLAIKQLSPLTSALIFFLTGIIFVHTPSIRYINIRKFKKITHLQKTKHPQHQQSPKVLKRL